MKTKKFKYLTSDEIAFQTTRLNPGVVSLKFEPITNNPILTTDFHPTQLLLPKGCYWNAKNGVTNKHQTDSGMYSCVQIKKSSK